MKPEDLTIYIATFNRCALLRETLESLFHQSVRGFRILVGDNASTDGTPDLLASLEREGVGSNRLPSTVDATANLHRGAALAQTPWLILYHDDDLMHPGYVAQVVESLTRHPDASLVAAAHRATTRPDPAAWQPCRGKELIAIDRASFLTRLYRGFDMHFASTVYRTPRCAATPMRTDLYGKSCDYPFVLDQTSGGPAILLPEAWAQYRQHPGQDGKQSRSGPFLREILNLHADYHRWMGDRPWRPSGRTWLLWNHQRIRPLMDSTGNPYRLHWKAALEAGAITWPSILLGSLRDLLARMMRLFRF